MERTRFREDFWCNARDGYWHQGSLTMQRLSSVSLRFIDGLDTDSCYVSDWRVPLEHERSVFLTQASMTKRDIPVCMGFQSFDWFETYSAARESVEKKKREFTIILTVTDAGTHQHKNPASEASNSELLRCLSCVAHAVSSVVARKLLDSTMRCS